MIDSETKDIQVHILEQGNDNSPEHYISTVYGKVETLNVAILPGLRMDFNSIWSVL
jgi:hypothetical protein